MKADPGPRPIRTLFLAAGMSCAWSLALASQPRDPGRPPGRPAAQPPPRPAPLPRNDSKTPPQPIRDPAVTPLADEPVHVDSIGMSFYPPAGATVQSTSVAAEGVVQIVAADNTWKIDVRAPRTSKPDITAEEAGEAVVRQLLETVGVAGPEPDTVRSLGKVLERTKYVPANRPQLDGYRAYVSMPTLAPSGKGPNVVRGFTVVKVGAHQFAAFDMTTTEPQYQAARGVYETVVASAEYSDLDLIMATRGSAVKAGLSLFERLTPEDYQAAMEARDDRWERLFVPSPTGAESDDKEIAYRRIRCRPGSRRDLDSPGTRKGPVATERDRGYILQIDARYLHEKRTIDSQAVFFMSLDRDEEAWTIRNAVREGKEVATTSETGARSGKSMTIQKEASGQPTYTVKPRFETDGYVSQFESYLLPQLLIRVKLPSEYAFYVYNFQDGLVKLRRDTLEQPADRPGLWRLSTKLSEDAKKPQVSLYNDGGQLIRTEMPDGSVWEPVPLDRLVRLWRSKNLPMD